MFFVDDAMKQRVKFIYLTWAEGKGITCLLMIKRNKEDCNINNMCALEERSVVCRKVFSDLKKTQKLL